MAKVILSRTNPRTGAREQKSYEIPQRLTFKEAGFVKRFTAYPGYPGVRAGEIDDALKAGDAECIAALVIISVRRAGEAITDEEILAMDVEDLDFEEDEVVEADDDADPSTGDAAASAPAEPAA